MRETDDRRAARGRRARPKSRRGQTTVPLPSSVVGVSGRSGSGVNHRLRGLSSSGNNGTFRNTGNSPGRRHFAATGEACRGAFAILTLPASLLIGRPLCALGIGRIRPRMSAALLAGACIGATVNLAWLVLSSVKAKHSLPDPAALDALSLFLPATTIGGGFGGASVLAVRSVARSPTGFRDSPCCAGNARFDIVCRGGTDTLRMRAHETLNSLTSRSGNAGPPGCRSRKRRIASSVLVFAVPIFV